MQKGAMCDRGREEETEEEGESGEALGKLCSGCRGGRRLRFGAQGGEDGG